LLYTLKKTANVQNVKGMEAIGRHTSNLENLPE
jgi:hypothetical protein